jgi:hypothetical protein
MQGVTTALVGFTLVCMIWPHLIKNKTQFYAGFAMIVVIILLDGLAFTLHSDAFGKFAYLFTAVLQVAALFVMYLSAGGLSARELAGEMGHAYEVIRRGEEEKEIIIPITGEQPKKKAQPTTEPEPQRIDIPAPKNKPDGNSSIPLE